MNHKEVRNTRSAYTLQVLPTGVGIWSSCAIACDWYAMPSWYKLRSLPHLMRALGRWCQAHSVREIDRFIWHLHTFIVSVCCSWLSLPMKWSNTYVMLQWCRDCACTMSPVLSCKSSNAAVPSNTNFQKASKAHQTRAEWLNMVEHILLCIADFSCSPQTHNTSEDTHWHTYCSVPNVLPWAGHSKIGKIGQHGRKGLTCLPLRGAVFMLPGAWSDILLLEGLSSDLLLSSLSLSCPLRWALYLSSFTPRNLLSTSLPCISCTHHVHVGPHVLPRHDGCWWCASKQSARAVYQFTMGQRCLKTSLYLPLEEFSNWNDSYFNLLMIVSSFC